MTASISSEAYKNDSQTDKVNYRALDIKKQKCIKNNETLKKNKIQLYILNSTYRVVSLQKINYFITAVNKTYFSL